MSWFGPFVFLLVIPGIIYSILRGKKSLQTLSLTLMGYAVILCYKVVWMPWNGRFFSLFFAASGVCVAYFIESVKFKRKFLIKSISYASILILFLSCAVNESKPLNIIPNQTLTGSHLIPLKWAHNIMHESIWAKTNWGRNRLYYAENHYFYRDKNSRLLDFKDTIPPESNIVLVVGEDSWIYHYLLSNPDQKFTPVSLLLNPDVNPLDFDYLLCIDEECRYRKFNVNENTLLDLISSTQPGELIELKHRVKIEGN
ncbi:hypothetical protein CWATWH8502_4003 [Crocosphaera watsonii WH 8502]|uniref:4-amino-4-deoxy-L-arabinose transferase and related glycosyltransferases of PMT family n=1 Tax=Crocosphaera watsonii WH 8502 TaxID=423474 RepID=T2I9U3_CROWT|nr:hypothetical protein CWATWH8502_4003 [Crocosphaera watsonii WH 8502]